MLAAHCGEGRFRIASRARVAPLTYSAPARSRWCAVVVPSPAVQPNCSSLFSAFLQRLCIGNGSRRLLYRSHGPRIDLTYVYRSVRSKQYS